MLIPPEDRQSSRASEVRPATLPPMPWRLKARGLVLVTLHWVEVERVRAQVPSELSIIPFLPGKTIGALFLARYGPGSELEYNELIVSSATVWHRRRPCAWVTHLFVDSWRSVEGGRLLLGAPKQFAPFTREEPANRTTIGAPSRPICRLSHGRQLWLWRQRVRLVALHHDVRDPQRSTTLVHGNELRARWGITRARVEIPEGSPLRDLGFGQPLLSVCAKEMDLLLGGAAFVPLHTLPAAAIPRAWNDTGEALPGSA